MARAASRAASEASELLPSPSSASGWDEDSPSYSLELEAQAERQKLASDLREALAIAERTRIEKQTQLRLQEVQAADEEVDLQRRIDEARNKLDKVRKKREQTASAHEEQQANLKLMLEAREATTEKEAALRQCDALERQLRASWAEVEGAVRSREAAALARPGDSLDLVRGADAIGAEAVESMLRAESMAMRTALRLYEKQQEDMGAAALARRRREAAWSLQEKQMEEEAELDLAEERLRLGEACLEDALRLVVPVDDGQSQLAEVVEELERQQASLEVAEAARDSLQDEASDMLLLFHAAESRAAELEKKLTASTTSRAASALEALRESGLAGAAALVVVLARLCGGPRLAFLAIDANNSGAVSTYEFDSALRLRLGLDYEAITGFKLRSLFKEFDTRHCGLVYGVDMVSAFADVWRRYGIPEEVARDPLLNPDLEGPAHDEVLREQQRWLRETRRPASPRSARSRQRSSSPQAELRTPRSDILNQKASVSPRIRDEWDRGYRTVGIPASPRSPRNLALPGVTSRSRPEVVPPLQLPRGAASRSPVQTSRSANTAGVMADSHLLASKQLKIVSSHSGALVGAARVRSTSSSGYSEHVESGTRSPNPAGAMKDSFRRKPESNRSATAQSYARDLSPGPAAAPSMHPPSSAGALPEAPRSTAGMSVHTRAPKAADAQSRSPSRPQAVQTSQTQRGALQPVQPRLRGAGSSSPQRASSPGQSDGLTPAKALPEPSTTSPRLPGGSGSSGPAGLHHGMSSQSRTKSPGEKAEVVPTRALPGGAGPAGMPVVHRQDGTAAAQTGAASSKSRPRSPGQRAEIEPTRARPGGAGPAKSEALAARTRTTPAGPEAAMATTLDHPHGVRSSSSPKYETTMRSTSGSASKSEAPRNGKALTPRSEDFAVVSTREHPRADRPPPRLGSPGERAGGAGPIPSPEVMAKASRARSPLYVAPSAAKAPKGQRARSPKATKTDPSAASVPSTLGMAPTRGGPTGRTPVAQSLQGMAEEWVESAHFPTKHTEPTVLPPKPFVRARRAPSEGSSSDNADAKRREPTAFAAPAGTSKREALQAPGRDSHDMLGPAHGRQQPSVAIAAQSVAVSAAGQPAQLRVSLDSGWESLTASPEDLQALTQGETPQVLWVRSDHEIENDPDATQQIFSQKALTSSPEDLQALMQGETPQVLWVRSDNEIENDADATQPAKQEDASAFAWPSKASARVRSPANTSPARSLANTSPATTSPSRSASPGYRGDARHGLFRTEGPRRNSRAKSPRTLYVGDHWSPYPSSPVKLKG